MLNQFLETGQIVGTHGIKGEIRVHPWCDSPDFLTRFKVLYKKDESVVDIESSRVHGNVVLMKLRDVDNINDAQSLRGTVLYISRGDVNLPDGEYFIQDLIGCEVFDKSGTILGVLSEVSSAGGANDVWHIKKDGREYLMPAVKEFISEIDIANRKVVVEPLKGVFDEESYED